MVLADHESCGPQWPVIARDAYSNSAVTIFLFNLFFGGEGKVFFDGRTWIELGRPQIPECSKCRTYAKYSESLLPCLGAWSVIFARL